MRCNKCKREFEVIYRRECKICGYWYRHKNLKEAITSKDFWSSEELDYILECLFYNKPKYINEIVGGLKNKTLVGLCELLSTDMRVGGNTNQKILLDCFICGKKMVKTLEFALKDRAYCSMECRDSFRSEHFVGENSSFYNRIETKCNYCEKKIKKIPYHINKTNSFGEHNSFCSKECYWNFRKIHYVGEKHPLVNKVYTDEERLQFAERTVAMIQNGVYPQTMTKPHVAINKLLDDNFINYENEFSLKYQLLDIYLTDYNIGIEIMGDYWHANPNKYVEISELNSVQLKNKTQDKRKHTYTKKYHGFEILYLWEIDINKNIKLCELLIKKYIETNGVLQDYNSFNYYVNDNELLLKSEIVTPYFIE